MRDRKGGLPYPGGLHRRASDSGAVVTGERYTHLVRLGRDLRALGVRTSVVPPVSGQPVLQVWSAAGALVEITVIRRRRGWVYTWPWWARLWHRGECVWAEADNAADIVKSAVIA
jgi:hypothetical protein